MGCVRIACDLLRIARQWMASSPCRSWQARIYAAGCQAVDGEFAEQKLAGANLRCGLPGCRWRVRRAEVGKRDPPAGCQVVDGEFAVQKLASANPCGLPGCGWRVRRAEVGKRDPPAGCQDVDGEFAEQKLASANLRCGLPGCRWRICRAEVGKRDPLRVASLSMASSPSRSWQARIYASSAIASAASTWASEGTIRPRLVK